jgi:hypothetical protein
MSENTSIALATPGALIPRGFEEAEKIANKLSESTMLPDHFKKNPANVFWALALGLEVGFTPVQALQAIYVVHGRPGMFADAMVALVLTSGKAEFFGCVESSDTAATYETKRKGAAKPRTITVTIEDAKKAGWTSNAKYQSEPRRMLEARCKSQLARDVYPDVLRGMVAVEEIQDDGAGGPTFTAPPPSKGDIIDIKEATSGAVPRGPEAKSKPAPAAEKPKEEPAAAAAPPPADEAKASADELAARAMLRRITDTKTLEDLEALLPEGNALINKLGKKHKDSLELRRMYTAHKQLLEKGAA